MAGNRPLNTTMFNALMCWSRNAFEERSASLGMPLKNKDIKIYKKRYHQCRGFDRSIADSKQASKQRKEG